METSNFWFYIIVFIALLAGGSVGLMFGCVFRSSGSEDEEVSKKYCSKCPLKEKHREELMGNLKWPQDEAKSHHASISK